MIAKIQNRKQMRTITECEKELNSILENYLKKLHSEPYKDYFREIFDNHMKTFKSRCAPLQKVFYHQHEIQNASNKDSGAYFTADQLIKQSEEKIKRFSQRTKDALAFDYEILLQN